MGQKGNPLINKVNMSIPWKNNYLGVGQYGLNFMKRNLLQRTLKFLIFSNLSYSFDFFRFKKTWYNLVDRVSWKVLKS